MKRKWPIFNFAYRSLAKISIDSIISMTWLENKPDPKLIELKISIDAKISMIDKRLRDTFFIHRILWFRFSNLLQNLHVGSKSWFESLMLSGSFQIFFAQNWARLGDFFSMQNGYSEQTLTSIFFYSLLKNIVGSLISLSKARFYWFSSFGLHFRIFLTMDY